MKIIHYINQFYAQIGGEEKADTPLSVRVVACSNSPSVTLLQVGRSIG